MLLPLMLEYQKSRQQHTLTFLLAMVACCLGERQKARQATAVIASRVLAFNP